MRLPRARRVSPYRTTPLGRCADPVGVLAEAAGLLDRQDVMVDAGTLLGLWRDGRLIPHDTDLDFAVIGPVGAATQLAPQLPEPYRLIRTIDHQERPSQRAYMRVDTIVDLYYFWADGATAINVSDVGVMRMPLEAVLPLRRWSWRGIGLRVPADPDGYLAWRYGPTWRTPHTAKGRWADDAPLTPQ